MRSGLTVVWGCRMLTGSVLATFWGISRIFSAMKPWTAFSASTVPWIRHTRSVVPANTNSLSWINRILQDSTNCLNYGIKTTVKSKLAVPAGNTSTSIQMRDFHTVTYWWPENVFNIICLRRSYKRNFPSRYW